jgi:biotin-dependent carboxylase-like uncharacterized protein
MISVVKPGLLTTIQDEGRPGWRAFGMPLAGAADADAYAAANLLAGNEPGAAAIEMTLLGATFRFGRPAWAAIAGADMQARLDGDPVPPWSAFAVRAGGVLAFSGARAGARCYLAVLGGVDVPVVLGSRSTYTRAAVGGLDGRALAAGDDVPVGPPGPARGPRGRAARPVTLPADLVPPCDREVRLRVILGPQDDRFGADGLSTFLGAGFTVTNRNDRMGYQLEGPIIRHAAGADIVSDGIVPGSVQVPGSGAPIVMMADCATVGGYTKIATAIGADLPRIAQARVGDVVRFSACTQADAVRALRQREAWLAAVAGVADGAPGGER